MTDTLTDEKLNEVAEALAVDKNLPTLGLKLGFRQTKVDLYMGINKRNDSFEGTTNMLFDWKRKTPRAKQIPDLVKALCDSSLAAFVDEFFPAGAGDGDPPTLQNSSAKSQQDQDKTTPFPSSPNAITSTSTATPTTDAAATTTTTTTTQKGLPHSTKDFNEVLLEVAKRVRKESEIDILGMKLGFTPADIHGYIATNHKTQHVTYDGTLLMLRDWQNRQKLSTKRGALKTALEESGQIHLADDLFPSNQ